ncbi:unnamed protein product [Gadus morhua 'NCC']
MPFSTPTDITTWRLQQSATKQFSSAHAVFVLIGSSIITVREFRERFEWRADGSAVRRPGPGSIPARMLNAKVPAAAAWEASSHFQSRSVRMMCEVMPTISEDTALSQRGSQSSASDPDSHFEQLMVNMLDERDRLLDTLRETQESLVLAQQHAQDVVYDRDSLQRQLSSALPQVRPPLWAGQRTAGWEIVRT